MRPRLTRRGLSVGLFAVLGALITAATWIGGDRYLALMLGGFYAVACAAMYLWSRGRGDLAAILALSGDERQRSIDSRATAFAGLVTLGVCLGGTAVNVARGGNGQPWALICAVGGLAYIGAVLTLRHRL